MTKYVNKSMNAPQSPLQAKFFSLLFILVNGGNMAVYLMLMAVVLTYPFNSNSKAESLPSLFLLLSLISCLATTFYILVRELIYKLIHWMGYHAQPAPKVIRGSRGYLEIPIFEKYSLAYKKSYQKRSLKYQSAYLRRLISFATSGTLLMVSYFVVIGHTIGLLHLKLGRLAFFLILLGAIFIYMFSVSRWQKEREKLLASDDMIVLAIEHGYPIFMKKA